MRREASFGGKVYDLSHLDPFPLRVEFEGRAYTALVEFSSHCFTEKFDPAKHGEDEAWESGGEVRAFDADRHRLSLSLPGLIRTLRGQTVYHAQRGNFFFVRSVDAPGSGGVPYVVFFRVFRARRPGIDVIVTVSSAYAKPGMTRYASPVKFPRLVDSRARGRELPLGPPRRIKRR